MTCAICGRVEASSMKYLWDQKRDVLDKLCWRTSPVDFGHGPTENCYRIGYEREKARADSADKAGPAVVKAWRLAMERAEKAEAESANLRRELDNQRRNNHARNVALDALHFVWCNGGCESGVHRYDHGELTQEIVDAAVENTNRLVGWWINKGFKAEWKTASADAKDAWMRAATENTKLRAELAESQREVVTFQGVLAATLAKLAGLTDARCPACSRPKDPSSSFCETCANPRGGR